VISVNYVTSHIKNSHTNQLIFCTRKIIKAETGEKKFIKIRSLKKYSKEKFLEDLTICDFPNYANYVDVNEAYLDIVEKTSDIINNIAPMKEICIKNNTAEWFDEEILEGIRARDKLFSNFKKSKSNVDNKNYNKARNQLQELIKRKKRNFVSQKLTENISKPRKLWKSLQMLGLSNKNRSPSNICLGDKDKVSFDNKENAETFKNFDENLSSDLVNKLPLPTDNFGKEKIKDFYKHLNIENNNFSLKKTT